MTLKQQFPLCAKASSVGKGVRGMFILLKMALFIITYTYIKIHG